MDFMTHFYRIFIGDAFNFGPLSEIVFRTAFMYFYTILNVRLMDKRSMGQLSPFEIIIIVALGTAVGDPMFYRHVPLVQAMIVISTIVLVERLLSKLADRYDAIEKFLVGNPVLLIKHGQLIRENLHQENVAQDELFSELRLKGIKNTNEIDYAFLEPSGNISILKSDMLHSNGIPTINQS